MMIFSDIPAHPYWDGKNMFNNFKHKFPFNKPTGFDSGPEPVGILLDQIVDYIMNTPSHIFGRVQANMNDPLVWDPETLLDTL